MKWLLALLLTPLVAAAQSLAHTEWLEEGAVRCPNAIYFGVQRYLFLNPCLAPRPDGVVERGRYRLEGQRILLAERTGEGAGAIWIAPQLHELRLEVHTADRLVLGAGGVSLGFRRAGAPPRLLSSAR